MNIELCIKVGKWIKSILNIKHKIIKEVTMKNMSWNVSVLIDGK